jgi:CheY-like chemotaxis protein
LINDILDFSKIDAGKLTFEIMPFDLRSTVEGVVEMLSERAESKRLELITMFSDEVPVQLRGDPGRLRQVLMNLIGNAIKFTEHGEVIVRTSCVRIGELDALIRFEVKDSGIGIPESSSKNLFHAFSQADGSTTRRYGGTGLGLAISKRLVRLMDGEIGLTSQEGVGSSFFFTARFERQLQPVAAEPDLSSVDLRRLRVLIVDDNATNRMVLRMQLESWGVQTAEAAGADAALELLAAARDAVQPYHLAVLDFQMPDCDGRQLAQRIHADASLAATPMIMMTSLGRHGTLSSELHALGVLLCIVKPVKQAKLYDAIRQVLASRNSSSQELPRLPILEHRLAPERLKAMGIPARILVAEDNSVNQKVILRQLARLGFRADAVADGSEALAALQRIPYDLVLMDCQMPEMDGYSATEEQRRRESDGSHVYIVALTASTMVEDRERCLAAGMDDYLSKPLKIQDLEQKLSQWLLRRIAQSASLRPVAGEQRPSEAGAAIDIKMLQASTDRNPEFMQDMINLYLDQSTQLLAALRDAAIASRTEETARIAHTLIGSSLTFGMQAVVPPLRSIESAAKQGQLADSERYLGEATSQLGRIRDFLHSVSVAELLAME